MRMPFISGSLGMGHVTRDLAMANAWRELQPSSRVEWLAGQPEGSPLSGPVVVPRGAGVDEDQPTSLNRHQSVTVLAMDSHNAWTRDVGPVGSVTAASG